MEDTELALLIDAKEDIKAQLKDLKKKQDILKVKIMTEMKIRDLFNMEIGERSVEIKACNRRNFEKEKALVFIEEKGADKEDFYTTSSYEMLLIKPIEKEVENNE